MAQFVMICTKGRHRENGHPTPHVPQQVGTKVPQKNPLLRNLTLAHKNIQVQEALSSLDKQKDIFR